MGRTVESVLTFLAYLVFGALAGMVGTFAHRSRIGLFDGITWWVGLGVALAALTCIAWGLRLYLEDRVPGLAFAIGVVATVALFTTGGAGESVVIPASANGFGVSEIWLFGSAILVFAPVIWPRIRQPKQDARILATGAKETTTPETNAPEITSAETTPPETTAPATTPTAQPEQTSKPD